MYQPSSLNDLINQARLNGDKEILRHLTMAQKAMDLRNFVDRAPEQIKLGWRNKCNTVLSIEDILG